MSSCSKRTVTADIVLTHSRRYRVRLRCSMIDISAYYTLDEETNVIAGHGESTTIGREMRSNNFVRA